MIVTRPKTLNNELGLFLNEGQSLDAVGDSRHDFLTDDFAIFFSYYKVTDNAGAYTFRINDGASNAYILFQENTLTLEYKTTGNPAQTPAITGHPQIVSSQNNIRFVCIRRNGNNLEVWINGYFVTSFDITGESFGFGATAEIGINTVAPGNDNDMFAHHLVITDAVTDDEIITFARYRGYLPSSLHANTLNHWALSQPYYYDDAGTLKAWDVVEQYNYAKVTALTPIHMTLNGFTAGEVGADEPANQDSIYSTKSKQVSNIWGLKFNGTDQYAQQDPVTNNIVTSTRDNLTVYARFDEINDTGDTDIPVLFRNGSSVAISIQTNAAANVITLSCELDGQTGNAQFANTDWDRPLTMIFEKTDEDPSNWILNLNGIIITPNSTAGTHGTTSTEFTFTQLTIGGAFSGAGNFDFDGILNDVALWDRILTIEERRDLYLHEVIPSSGLLERINPEKRSDNQINTFAGNQLLLTNFTLADYNSYYRLKKSGLPEAKNCIDLNAVGRSVDIPSLQSSSLECVLLLNTDIADLDDIFTFGTAPTITKYLFNGQEVADEAALVAAINDNNICQISLVYNQLTTTITIGNYDGYLMQFALNWNDEENKNASKRSMLENWYNMLIKSTRGSRTDYYLFNTENDGIDYIAGNDATLNNITATEIIEINTLR